jgi:hypothetical protein
MIADMGAMAATAALVREIGAPVQVCCQVLLWSRRRALGFSRGEGPGRQARGRKACFEKRGSAPLKFPQMNCTWMIS